MRVLALSPHLDDVAFSIPGRIVQLLGDGHEVVVASLFTEGEGEGAYEARQKEDAAVWRRLGVAAHHCGLLDAPFRPGGAFTYERLFFPEALDGDALSRTYDSVAGLFASQKFDLVLAPLGIGGHVDHLLVYETAMRLQERAGCSSLEFYEDRPYAWVGILKALRDQQLGFGSVSEMSLLAIQDAFSQASCLKLLPKGGAKHLTEVLGRTCVGGTRCMMVRRDAFTFNDAVTNLLDGYPSQQKLLFGGRTASAVWRHILSDAPYEEVFRRLER